MKINRWFASTAEALEEAVARNDKVLVVVLANALLQSLDNLERSMEQESTDGC